MIGWQPWSSLNLRAQDIKPQIWWHDYKINHRPAAVPPSHALLDHTVMSHVKSASGTLESPDRDLPAKHKGSQRSLGALNRCSAYRYRQQCGLICRFECEGKHSSTGDPVRWGDTSIPTPAYHLSPCVTPKQSWDPLQENSQCLSGTQKLRLLLYQRGKISCPKNQFQKLEMVCQGLHLWLPLNPHCTPTAPPAAGGSYRPCGSFRLSPAPWAL